jgi:hypothetical protein
MSAFPPSLHHGDIFLTRNPQRLGRLIVAVQSFHDPDGKSKYSHSGIIVGPDSHQSIEARWRTGFFCLEEYAGDDILIARHDKMEPQRHYAGLQTIDKHIGQRYPFYRLLCHLLGPGFCKWSLGYAVCSELTSKYLCGCGLQRSWKGHTPGHLENVVTNYREWSVVFEGKWRWKKA